MAVTNTVGGGGVIVVAAVAVVDRRRLLVHNGDGSVMDLGRMLMPPSFAGR